MSEVSTTITDAELVIRHDVSAWEYGSALMKTCNSRCYMAHEKKQIENALHMLDDVWYTIFNAWYMMEHVVGRQKKYQLALSSCH